MRVRGPSPKVSRPAPLAREEAAPHSRFPGFQRAALAAWRGVSLNPVSHTAAERQDRPGVRTGQPGRGPRLSTARMGLTASWRNTDAARCSQVLPGDVLSSNVLSGAVSCC